MKILNTLNEYRDIYRRAGSIQLFKELAEYTEERTDDEGNPYIAVTGRDWEGVTIPRTEDTEIVTGGTPEEPTYTDPVKENFDTYFATGQTLEIAELKVARKLDITAHRDAVRSSTLVHFNGHGQRIRKSDVSDIDALIRMIEVAGDQNWFYSDESTELLTVQTANNLGLLMGSEVESIYQEEARLKAIVDSYTTAEELESFIAAVEWGEI